MRNAKIAAPAAATAATVPPAIAGHRLAVFVAIADLAFAGFLTGVATFRVAVAVFLAGVAAAFFGVATLRGSAFDVDLVDTVSFTAAVFTPADLRAVGLRPVAFFEAVSGSAVGASAIDRS